MPDCQNGRTPKCRDQQGECQAPRELVFAAGTDRRHVERWWGPKGFTTTTHEMEVRPGGVWRHTMHGPDGRAFPREIVPMERIVCTDSFADEKGKAVPASHYALGAYFPMELQVTITFEERDGKTTMTLRHAGIPAGEVREMTSAGWNESFDKLAESLR